MYQKIIKQYSVSVSKFKMSRELVLSQWKLFQTFGKTRCRSFNSKRRCLGTAGPKGQDAILGGGNDSRVSVWLAETGGVSEWRVSGTKRVTMMNCNRNDSLTFSRSIKIMGVEPKIGFFPPKSSHFNRDFHYFHHPCWWFSPYFWVETQNSDQVRGIVYESLARAGGQ